MRFPGLEIGSHIKFPEGCWPSITTNIVSKTNITFSIFFFPPYTWLNKTNQIRLQNCTILCADEACGAEKNAPLLHKVYLSSSPLLVSAQKPADWGIVFETRWQGLRLVNGADDTSATCGESDSSLNLISGQRLQEIDGQGLLIRLCLPGQSELKASIDLEWLLGTTGRFLSPHLSLTLGYNNRSTTNRN